MSHAATAVPGRAAAENLPDAGGAGAHSRPLHVMHVMYTLRPGGMEFGVVKLVNGLDPARVRSSICSTTPAAGDMKARVCSDVPIFELQRRPGNDPLLIKDLVRLFRRERPDIVHTHAWGTLVEGLVAARLARVPYVVHGEHGTLQLRRYQRWLQRVFWGQADVVLSVSSRLAERMARETGFGLERIRTLRNGVDMSRFGMHVRIEARRELGLGQDALVVGTAGRLVPVKDHAGLLRAAAESRSHGHDFTLVIAGEGPLRNQLEGLAASLGIADRVRFLGYRADVDRVFSALDLFVLSSVSEGLSNTILEAMASGLPVVATRVGGADELVTEGETGTLVPAGSPDELGAAIGGLLRDPERRRRMGTAARRRALTEFSLPAVISRYEQVYAELAPGIPAAVKGARRS